jgi:hypothetical protein
MLSTSSVVYKAELVGNDYELNTVIKGDIGYRT